MQVLHYPYALHPAPPLSISKQPPRSFANSNSKFSNCLPLAFAVAPLAKWIVNIYRQSHKSFAVCCTFLHCAVLYFIYRYVQIRSVCRSIYLHWCMTLPDTFNGCLWPCMVVVRLYIVVHWFTLWPKHKSLLYINTYIC